MRKTRIWVVGTMAVLCSACANTRYANKDNSSLGQVAGYIPQAPDYRDATMWITKDGDTLGTGVSSSMCNTADTTLSAP